MAARRSSFTVDRLRNGLVRVLELITLALLACYSNVAQSGTGPSSLPPNTPAILSTIKNAPFSAQVITQYDHVLSNGNHIHRETQGRIFRDSFGRVRTETQVPTLGGNDLEHIAIQDPVLNELIHLDPRTKTANIHHLGEAVAMTPPPNHSRIPMKGGNAILLTPEAPGSGTSVVPLRQGSATTTATESLGTKMIEGLTVVGTRTSRTCIEGQGEPIVAVNEVWFSRDLQMVILSISDDGQSGRSIMRVTNIVRRSPNERLFQVPPDYTVKDGNPIAAVLKH